jgi:hypothetical protein
MMCGRKPSPRPQAIVGADSADQRGKPYGRRDNGAMKLEDIRMYIQAMCQK